MKLCLTFLASLLDSYNEQVAIQCIEQVQSKPTPHKQQLFQHPSEKPHLLLTCFRASVRAAVLLLMITSLIVGGSTSKSVDWSGDDDLEGGGLLGTVAPAGFPCCCCCSVCRAAAAVVRTNKSMSLSTSSNMSGRATAMFGSMRAASGFASLLLLSVPRR